MYFLISHFLAPIEMAGKYLLFIKTLSDHFKLDLPRLNLLVANHIANFSWLCESLRIRGKLAIRKVELVRLEMFL